MSSWCLQCTNLPLMHKPIPKLRTYVVAMATIIFCFPYCEPGCVFVGILKQPIELKCLNYLAALFKYLGGQ